MVAQSTHNDALATPPPANSVSGTSGSDVWAVGTGIHHWNGSAWAQSFAMAGSDTSDPNGSYTNVWVSPTQVWLGTPGSSPGARAERPPSDGP